MKEQNEVVHPSLMPISLEEYIKRQKGVEEYRRNQIESIKRLSIIQKAKWSKRK